MEKEILNLIVTDIDYDNDKVICRVIETDELRIFDKELFGDNFFDTPNVDDEFIATITSGAGFIEVKIVPDTKKESRIVIRKCIHKGEHELDCYVPQIRINDMWYNVLEKGSYILKDSFDPVVLCKKCYGEGCPECHKRGFRKGTSVDLKYIAQSFLDKKLKELNDARDVINNFIKPQHSLTGKAPEISFNKFKNE